MKVSVLGFCIGIFTLLSLPSLAAQTAAELDAALESGALTCGQAARFALASVENPPFPEPRSEEEAFNQAKTGGWLPGGAAAYDPVRLGELSYLLMRAFDLKGGLMYTLFPGPRYALRSLVSRSIIQGPADPAMTVSGERFLLILGNLAALRGNP
jgi:hypothetical protein